MGHQQLDNALWKEPHFPITGIATKGQMLPRKLHELFSPSSCRVQYKTIGGFLGETREDSGSFILPEVSVGIGDFNSSITSSAKVQVCPQSDRHLRSTDKAWGRK